MVSFNSENIQAAIDLMANSKHIAILTHMHPDGDAMGSSTGMLHFLEKSGKSAHILLNDKYPDNLSFLIGDDIRGKILILEENPEGIRKVLEECDLMLCLDFNNLSRTEGLQELAASTDVPKILIDHHLSPVFDQFTHVFSETAISSASELSYWFLKEALASGRFPEVTALPLACGRALMTGMTTDTNNFANSVFPSTLQMASELLTAGVDRDDILSNLYNKLSENRLRLMGHLMKDVLEITPDGVAFITLSKEDAARYQIREGETEGFVNMPLSIDRVRMSIFSKEDEGRARISIRSKKGTSANLCARAWFNGGGHEQAAGGKLVYGTDVADFSEVPEYIRIHTHKFLKGND